MAEIGRDLTRTVLAIVFLAALIGGSLWILQPFLPAIVWAAMVVIATWPLLRTVQTRLGNSRGLAVAVMTHRSCWSLSCRSGWRSAPSCDIRPRSSIGPSTWPRPASPPPPPARPPVHLAG